MFVEIKQSGLSRGRAKDYFWQPFAKIKLTVLSLSLSIYLSFYSFGHRLSSILSARFFLVTKLLSPLCSTEQWKGEREKERERGRYGVGTPGSDPSQLLPIIRVLGFTPTGSTTCSTRLRLCLRARPETLSALSSPRPPFFQTRISNVSATGSKRRLG